MDFLDGYDRRRAIEDGLLIDVSESIGKQLGLTYPVAVSTAVWNHPEVEGDPGHLEFIVRAAVAQPGRLVGLEVGEFSSGEFPSTVVFDRRTYAGVVSVRVIFETTEDCGIVATIVEKDEVFDLRCPRAGSFYPV